MADLQPLRTLRYDTSVAGPLEDLIAPPYDVIDDAMRAELAARSPYNVVEIDLPPSYDAGRRHDGGLARARRARARRTSRPCGCFARTTRAPDGAERTRTGFLARVRVDEYGPGRIRPHERTHPGPKEDRLRLTRATRTNLSPIFTLFPDPDGFAERAMARDQRAASPSRGRGEHRSGDPRDPDLLAELQMALADAELLIADGHHRYETARVYADEVGGEGEHRYVLMLLCSLDDPGLLVFPTHRLLTGLKDDSAKQEAIRDVLMRDFEIEELGAAKELEPPPRATAWPSATWTPSTSKPYRVTLKDQAIADRALDGMPEPYRRLDTAVLEALVLRGALGMSEDDISHLRGLDYSKDLDDAIDAVDTGRADAGFFMRATPVEQVREVAETGESMPPKSTYFYPKVPTGLVFNPLV